MSDEGRRDSSVENYPYEVLNAWSEEAQENHLGHVPRVHGRGRRLLQKRSEGSTTGDLNGFRMLYGPWMGAKTV